MSICQGPPLPHLACPCRLLPSPDTWRFTKVGSTFTLVRSPWQLVTYGRLGRVFSDQKVSLIEPFALASLFAAFASHTHTHTRRTGPVYQPDQGIQKKKHHFQQVCVKFPILYRVCRLSKLASTLPACWLPERQTSGQEQSPAC